MDSTEANGTNTKILLNGGSKGFKKWNGDVWEQVPLAESSKDFEMQEDDEVDEGLPMKVLEFMGLPKSYRKTLYREFVHDVAQIPTETASSFNNIVNWICGEGDSEINIVPKSASSAGEGDIGGRVERLQIVSTSSNESVGSQKTIRILRTDSTSNMNIVTPFGILISDDQKQMEPEQPQHFQLVEAMEVQVPNNMIKIAPSLHGLKFEEVPHDKTDIKITEALFHKTLLVEEQPSEKGDTSINNSNVIFRKPSKLEINLNENRDNKASKTLLFRKPSKHVCMSETSIYCYQKSDTEEEVESRQMKTTTSEEKKLNEDMANNTNQNQSQSRRPCTSETSIYCYGVSESETEGEFNSKLNDNEETNEVEEVKRVTFASPSETNIYAYQDYDEEDEQEQMEVHCHQIEVNGSSESQEAKEDLSSDSMSKERKDDYHLEGQMSEKESGTEEEESMQEEEPSKSERRPRRSHKIRERRIQNEVLEQIKQILQENNKVNEKKVYNNALVQTRDVPQEIQVEKVLSDALVQTKDIDSDGNSSKEQNISSALPRQNPVSIMKTSRGNNSSKTSIQFSLPHQVASFSSHDILSQLREIPSEPYRINAQTNLNVGLVQTSDMSPTGFREIFHETSPQTNNTSHHIEERGKHSEKHNREQQSPNIQAQQNHNQGSQHMNEIPGENKLYNFKPLEQAKEFRGFTPPQEKVQERKKGEALIPSISCPADTTACAVDKEKSPQNTTSEVQMQLNSDLKKLENIVKKLYKSLNKKGPLTLVANFKPKENGELSLDMGSLTGKPKKEVSFSAGLSGDGNSSDKLTEKTSKLKVEDTKHDYTKEFTKEPERQEIGRNLSQRTSSPVVPQVVSKSGSMNMSNLKPASPPTAIPRHAPMSIMKASHAVNSSKPAHHPSNSQQAASSNSQKPSVTISLNNDVNSCSMRSGGSKTNVDINNNVEMPTPPPSPKSALKQTPSKMPLLRPASSSHSMLKTCIENEAPSAASKKESEIVPTPPRPKTSRSKHYILQTPVSNHDLVEHPKTQPNTYKLVEGTNSKHYLVPVTSQHQQPKQVLLTASRSRSNTTSRSQSQHVLIAVPPRRNQSQHLFTQPSPSKSILREHIRPKSRQQPSSISPSGSRSQHIMMEGPSYSRYAFEEPRPKTVRHVFVQPPPTCQNPHLHPRTATILSPPESLEPHMRNCTAPSFASRYGNGGYRIMPCSMHQDHPPHQSSHQSHHRREQEYSTAEETASNTSLISSLSTRTENNLSAPSDGEEREHFHVRNIPSKSHQSCYNWQQQKQESRSLAPSISPSVRVHIQDPAQSPSKTLTSSPSATKQQYRTTIRIPPGPPKNSYREFEDILSAPSDADSHVEPSRSRRSCHNFQQQKQQSRPPAHSNSPSVRVQVRNPASNTVTHSESSTKQQYRATIRIPSRHSKLGSSEIEDNLSAPSDNENIAEERVELRDVPSRSRSSCHNWQQQNRSHQTSISPSVKVQARNVSRSTSKSMNHSTTSTKEQYRTTLHIPTGPPKPSSYCAIFKEKQQKQKQTVYVDLTSNGNRKNNR